MSLAEKLQCNFKGNNGPTLFSGLLLGISELLIKVVYAVWALLWRGTRGREGIFELEPLKSPTEMTGFLFFPPHASLPSPCSFYQLHSVPNIYAATLLVSGNSAISPSLSGSNLFP